MCERQEVEMKLFLSFRAEFGAIGVCLAFPSRAAEVVLRTQFHFASANTARHTRPVEKFTACALSQIHLSCVLRVADEIEFIAIDSMRPSTISHLFHFCWACEKRRRMNFECSLARRPINKKQLPNKCERPSIRAAFYFAK